MSERIDIDALHDIIQQHLVSGGGHELDSLHAELQRMYEREDELLDTLRSVERSLDHVQGYYQVHDDGTWTYGEDTKWVAFIPIPLEQAILNHLNNDASQ